MEKIHIDDVVFDAKWYPRERPSSKIIEEYADALASGAEFPPIVLERNSKKLLDGYHRWKSRQRLLEQPQLLNGTPPEEIAQINVVYHDVPKDVTPQLYAYSLSSRHGHRPTKAEAKAMAEVQYQAMPGTPMSTFKEYLGVSDKTAKSYIKHLVAQFEDDKRTVMIRLHGLGWTQQEIADKLQELWPSASGTSQDTVSESLRKFGNFRISVKSDFDKGHPIDKLSRLYAMPELLLWSMLLEGDDATRLKQIGINVQPYDVWNFPKCHDLLGTKHPGRIPGELVAHVLYFFTEPGQTVIDPMVGGGTTLDTCLVMDRKCYGYDIDLRHDRPDVIQHNLAVDGWPERIKKADLIFWDPPYFDKMDSTRIGEDGYIDGSISKLDREEYLSFFADRLSEAKSLVKPGTRLAFLMSDWDDHEGQRAGIFVWDYARIIEDAGWTLKRHIQVPLSTQQVHPDVVNRFRESRRLARLERYLLIAEV